ncbi:MAG: class I SAM-dependent methyltransferase [Gordonia polyisoprenivorans]|nr:class I SAM-dependent methyltransferase [Gordonia polyisoprenivorans]
MSSSNSLVDPHRSGSLPFRARQKRWAKLLMVFPDLADMHVLDLGGVASYWHNAPVQPEHVTLVNLRPYPSENAITCIAGDACNPPSEITGTRFDVVISNSLIEHVGGHVPRTRLADVVHKAADRHWVQTPYRYFPIEPHWVAPGLQFLPFEARVRATMRWRYGHMQTNDRQVAIDNVNDVELLGLTQMRDYFGQSIIWTERFAGLVKSMVAIRT